MGPLISPRCACSSSTATCCEAPAQTSTTPASWRPWYGSGTRSTSCARIVTRTNSSSLARSATGTPALSCALVPSRAPPSIGPTSAGCSPCTWPTATRTSRLARSRELSDDEVERYLAANVAAVRKVVAARARRRARQPPDHGPGGPGAGARGRRALRGQGPWQRARVHRQAASERFLPYAREGIAPARGVLVGSRHTAESLWEALETRPARAHAAGAAGSRHRHLPPRDPERGRPASRRSPTRLAEAPDSPATTARRSAATSAAAAALADLARAPGTGW